MNDSAQTVRAFVALNIPPELHERIQRIQSRLRYLEGASAIRWTRPAQFHLTLEFLGDIDANRVGDVLAEIQSACLNEAPLKLELSGLGCFPSFEKPSVAWLGVTGETERLAALQRRIREGVRKFEGRRDEHAFSPHMTLGRVKSSCFKIARVFGKALQIEMTKIASCGEWTATRIDLMRSDTQTEGAVYSELGCVELKP